MSQAWCGNAPDAQIANSIEVAVRFLVICGVPNFRGLENAIASIPIALCNDVTSKQSAAEPGKLYHLFRKSKVRGVWVGRIDVPVHGLLELGFCHSIPIDARYVTLGHLTAIGASGQTGINSSDEVSAAHRGCTPSKNGTGKGKRRNVCVGLCVLPPRWR